MKATSVSKCIIQRGRVHVFDPIRDPHRRLQDSHSKMTMGRFITA